MPGVVGSHVSKGLEVTENKAAFLELGMVGPGPHGVRGDGVTEPDGMTSPGVTVSGFHRRARGGPLEVSEQRHIRPVPHCPEPSPWRLPPQTSAPCAFNVLTLTETISRQLYTNSCGELSPTLRPPATPATTRLREVLQSAGLSQTQIRP